LNILFIGDIVGELGREMLRQYIPLLKSKYQPDIIIANGENSAGGKGITLKIYHELISYGIDLITMGNHTWDNKEIFNFIDTQDKIIRPANYPNGTPGKGYSLIKKNGLPIFAVINLQGRTYLPSIDCPFQVVNKIIDEIRKVTNLILIDFHAEASSEKQALAWYLNGKISAIIGTHTHVQTADERILPLGTGYITDVGMTGPYDGIIGMEKETVIRKFITQLPIRFEVAKGRGQLNAVILNIDNNTGMVKKIERIRIDQDNLLLN